MLLGNNHNKIVPVKFVHFHLLSPKHMLWNIGVVSTAKIIQKACIFITIDI